jgi:hypothetical protein
MEEVVPSDGRFRGPAFIKDDFFKFLKRKMESAGLHEDLRQRSDAEVEVLSEQPWSDIMKRFNGTEAFHVKIPDGWAGRGRVVRLYRFVPYLEPSPRWSRFGIPVHKRRR